MSGERFVRSPVPKVAIDAAWEWAYENGMLVSGGMNPSRPVEAAFEKLTADGWLLLSPEQVAQVREALDDPEIRYVLNWHVPGKTKGYALIVAIKKYDAAIALWDVPKEER